VLAGVDEAGSAAEEEQNGLLVLTPVTRRPRRTHPGCTTIRYRRKNNPELDRRRVHFCDAPGQSRRVLRPPAMTTWRSLSRCKILLKSMR